MIEPVSEGYFTTCVVIARDGSIATTYQKRKPTNVLHGKAGDTVGWFETEFGRIALLICYDAEDDQILRETLDVSGRKFKCLYDPLVLR